MAQNKRKQGIPDLETAVPTQEALLGGIHLWRLHDHAEQLAAVRAPSNAAMHLKSRDASPPDIAPKSAAIYTAVCVNCVILFLKHVCFGQVEFCSSRSCLSLFLKTFVGFTGFCRRHRCRCELSPNFWWRTRR